MAGGRHNGQVAWCCTLQCKAKRGELAAGSSGKMAMVSIFLFVFTFDFRKSALSHDIVRIQAWPIVAKSATSV
jgi:hypothetical protein